MMIAEGVKEIGKMTDYEYSRTLWHQVMDQLFGVNLEGEVDFIKGNGRVLLYCVQATFLSFEMISELLTPCQEQNWAVKTELKIALEDDYWGVSFERYLEDLIEEAVTGKPREADNFNHYFVWLKMPKVEQEDKQYWLLIDQTEQKARFIPEEAVMEDTEGQVIIDSKQTWLVDQTGKLKRPKEQESIRIVIAPELNGMSLGILGGMMRQLPHLEAYYEKLDQFHPMVSWQIASDESRKKEIRTGALKHLAESFPFFMGEAGFSTPAEYGKNLSVMLRLANDNQLPVISLFISRLMQVHGMLSNRKQMKKLVNDCVMQCALMADGQWAITQKQYQKIILKADLQQIEKKRQWLKKQKEAKKQALAKKTKKDIGESSRASEKFLWLEALKQLSRKEATLEKTENQPGSKNRFRQWKDDITKAVSTAEKRLKDDKADPKLGEVTSQQPLLTDKEKVEANKPAIDLVAPVAISENARQQAIELLLSKADQQNVEQILELVGDVWRTFVRDGRITDQVKSGGLFAETSFDNLQAAIVKTLAIKNLSAELAEMDTILTRPRLQVLQGLRNRFGDELMLESGSDTNPKVLTDGKLTD